MNLFPAVCCCNAALVRPPGNIAGPEPCTPPGYMDVLMPGYSAVVLALLVVRAMALTMYSKIQKLYLF